MEPLRIGILGAARIAQKAIVTPANATGHRLVAVAARDSTRAERFARTHGVERVVASYDELLADPEVELVYNPLVNALHAPWNLRALVAGKHVLSEKPSASTSEQARAVRAVAMTSPGRFMEGFHYHLHPVFRRVLELVETATIGRVLSVEVSLSMPAPDSDDPRWAFDLAGGALMDLGCYSFHASRMLGRFLGGEPTVVSARAVERGRTQVDEQLRVELSYPDGTPGVASADMTAPGVDFHCRIVGSAGQIDAPAFVLPHTDDSVVLSTSKGRVVERLGSRSSYTYQLEAVARHIRADEPFVCDADDAVATMELIDASYLAAGLPLRQIRSTEE